MQRLESGRVPKSLVEMHSGGQPICLVGRYSQPYAFREAVNDFLAAADFLATCGVDVRDALPERDHLEAMLKASKSTRSKERGGKVFENWYLVIDLKASHGVVCLISCGSGHKINEDLQQPFVSRVAKLLQEHGAVALFASRIDRLSRVSWAFGPVMIVLEYVKGYLADALRGF